jgi:hypothetical protein
MKPLTLSILFLSLTALSSNAQTTIFSVPGAGTGDGQGTFPVSINSSGLVAGYYLDSSSMAHGFTYKSGVITTFEAFGNAAFTYVSGMNESGTIVGWFQGHSSLSTGSLFGFVRSSSGAYTVIQGAIGNQDNQISTYPTAINSSGEVTGYWTDNSSSGEMTTQAFVRSANGEITSFEYPGAAVTAAWAINDSGTVAGEFDGGGGFTMDAFGNFTDIFPPGDPLSILPTAINSSGEVAGYIQNTGSIPVEAFTYNPATQAYTVIDVPKALAFTGMTEHAVAMNDSGELAGGVENSLGYFYGWTDNNATVREFSICGDGEVTFATNLNNAGRLIGYCGTFNGPFDGFTH